MTNPTNNGADPSNSPAREVGAQGRDCGHREVCQTGVGSEHGTDPAALSAQSRNQPDGSAISLTKQQCGIEFASEGEIYRCSLSKDHTGMHGRIELLTSNERTASYADLLVMVAQRDTEIERLQKSIDRCGTEEGVCYAVEMERKDKEIERLRADLQKATTGLGAVIEAERRSTHETTTGGVDAFTWELAQKQLSRLTKVEQERAQFRADAIRYRWLRDWYHREGKRSEIDPDGHITVRTLLEWEALLDAAIARSPVETGPKPDAEKAPVTAADPCPTGDWVHEEHNGKCVYCGAPMTSQSKVTTEGRPLTHAEAAVVEAFSDELTTIYRCKCGSLPGTSIRGQMYCTNCGNYRADKPGSQVKATSDCSGCRNGYPLLAGAHERPNGAGWEVCTAQNGKGD